MNRVVTIDDVVTPVDRTTTSVQVTETLRSLILDGRLEPGTPLRQEQLSASLGVSRNTLREALRGLAEQGLVTHRPHHGVVVTDLDETDVADLYGLRRVLETAGLPAVAGDADRLDSMLASAKQFGDALERHDHVAALEHDFAFHRAIVATLGSRRIDEAYTRAQAELRPVLLQLDAAYEDPTQVAEHLRSTGAGAEPRFAGRRAPLRKARDFVTVTVG